MKIQSNFSEYVAQIIAWPLKIKIILLTLLTVIIISAFYLAYFKPKRAVAVTNMELIKTLTTDVNNQQLDLPNYMNTNKTIRAEKTLVGNFLFREIIQLNHKFNLLLCSIAPISTNKQQAVQFITQGSYLNILALMRAISRIRNVSLSSFIIQPIENKPDIKTLTLTLNTYTL